MSEDKILKVKKDLRRLRKLSHAIAAELRAKEIHERRLAYLRSIEDPGEDVLIDMMRIEEAIGALRVDVHIKEAADLEAKYIEAIGTLDELDRAIVVDGFINGKAYWKIGRDIGYTEAGIKKRVDAAIDKIVKTIG